MTNYTIPNNVFTDFEDYVITASALPAGISYSSATRTFSGTPTATGTTTITLTATDDHGAT